MKAKILSIILFLLIGLAPFAANHTEIRIDQTQKKNQVVYIDAINSYHSSACAICWE